MQLMRWAKWESSDNQTRLKNKQTTYNEPNWHYQRVRDFELFGYVNKSLNYQGASISVSQGKLFLVQTFVFQRFAYLG